MEIKWYTNSNKDYFVNVKNIGTSTIEELNPFYLKFFELSDRIESLIKEAVFTLLKRLERFFLKDSVYSIIKEATVNGTKANIKRSFFAHHNLDINSEEDYNKGIKSFKEDMLSHMDFYTKKVKEENKYVLLRMEFDKDTLTISIKNNTPIQKLELERIEERVEIAKDLDSMAELFTSEFDDTEGSGLGISMIILLLKNEGINTDVFSVKSTEEATICQVKIPLEMKKEQLGYKIANKMTEEINHLPTFDRNVKELQELMSKKENVNMEKIAQLVQKDISLTSSILKLVNSSAFSIAQRTDDITKAIKIIGLKELNNILYTLGTKRIMESRYKSFEEIWETSNECAYICTCLGKKLGLSEDLINTISIAGLLHDIGRVILLSLNEETVRSVMKISGIRNEPPDLVLEEAVIGINHTTIGVMIAQKWHFPENIQQAIEHHHTPYLIEDDDYKQIVYTVYMADRIVEQNQGMENFDKIYRPALKYFDFDREKYEKFAEKTKKKYIANKL